MKAYEIINYLEDYFPIDLQQPWDNNQLYMMQ